MSEPWFPMYSSDWLAGTSGLTAAEKGVYITLLCLMYEAEEPIARDDARLARRCGATLGNFRKALDGLIATGKITQDGAGLWNHRVAQVVQVRSQKRNAARASADARWSGKANKNNGPAMRSHSERNANQNHNQRDTNVSLKKGYSPSFLAFWSAWPSRQAKEKAATAFAKLSDAEQEEATKQAARWFEAWRAANPTASDIHATTYLNQKRWHDEMPKPKGQTNEPKRSIAADAAAAYRSRRVDCGEGGDPSQPLLPAGQSGGSADGGNRRLDCDADAVFDGGNIARLRIVSP